MTTLITGGGGQLASDLADRLGDDAVMLRRGELDITDHAGVGRAIDDIAPTLIVNCAAYHNVGECEKHPDLAWQANVDAVRNLAKQGVRLIHLSTNYVFDGRRDAPYREDDLPSPRSMYALTKLAGEYAALGYGTRPLVVRTAGLYGLRGSESKGGNFVQRMIARAREQGNLSVVADQHLQPTFTGDLADAVIEAANSDAEGILHLTASDACSWHEFTVEILRLADIGVSVAATETRLGPSDIDRPLNGVLARPGTDALGLTPLRAWQTALEDYMSLAGLLGAPTTC